MQEWKIAYVNNREVPVLISDEREALLAAKAAGRAIVGLWRPEQAMDEISAAKYVVENLEDVTEEYLERIARRHLRLPWRICETERLVIREMFADDFDEVWENQIGLGFGSVEELEAYTKHQYTFYEFGFWALLEKENGELIGVAGLKVPEEDAGEAIETFVLSVKDWKKKMNFSDTQEENVQEKTFEQEYSDDPGEILELGYHIFRRYRQKGYATEACKGILKYGVEELGTTRFMVRIDKENTISQRLADSLGFRAGKA